MQILIIDDHPLFREGVGLLLTQFDPDLRVATLGTISEALAQPESSRSSSLILLDLELPDTTGYDGLERIREAFPAVPVVMLSAEQDPDRIIACIDRGAMGFVTKASSTDVFRAAMRLIASGGVYIPPDALRILSPSSPGESFVPGIQRLLSPREFEILQALIEGSSNKAIARQMNITEQTVKFHVSNLLKRLEVRNRTQAVIAAARMGMKLSKISGKSDP